MPSPRRGSHDKHDKRDRAMATGAEPESVLFGLPGQRKKSGAKPASVATALPNDVERDLAALAGVEVPAPAERVDDEMLAVAPPRSSAPADYAQRLLRVAQLVTVGAFALMALAAVLAARYGGTRSLDVHELPFALWGLAA